MKTLACALLILTFPLYVHAQKPITVMDWKTDVTLNTYLVQEMQEQYAVRQASFQQALRSKPAALQYIRSVRERFRSLLPKFPARTPLQAEISGRISKEEYSIEKLVYQSFPGHHVTANLYLPAGKGPFPAVLFFCGHEDVSKATQSYQQTAISLARNGFVVMVIDPISQSERHQLTSPEGKPLTRGGTTEHTLLNASSNLLGGSTPADQLWDNVRGLDYLLTRSEVDPQNIGCLGNSGGAIQAIYFAGFEERIKAVAVCSFLMQRERTLELTGASDGCSHMPGEGAKRLEMADLLAAAAPRPILVLAGKYDFIDYTGTVAATKELEQLYRASGNPGRVQFFSVEDGHGLSQPKREVAVSFFSQWLKGKHVQVKEKAAETLTDKELFATKTGTVNTAFREVSLVDRNAAQYQALEGERNQWLQKEGKWEQQLRQFWGLGQEHKPQAERKEGAFRNNLYYQRVILRREGEVPMPALYLAPAEKPSKVIVWLHEGGKQKLADSIALLQQYLGEGAAVVLSDLRGMGETEDRADANDPKYYNREYRNAMLALHIGRSLPVQRTADVETVLYWVADQWKGLPVELHASGAAAIPSLQATVLHQEVRSLNLYQTIRSYKEMLDQPLLRHWYSYVIPGVLSRYDLPQLVGLAGRSRIAYHQ